MSENTRYGFPVQAWESAKIQANAVLEERARQRGTITYGEICRAVSAIELKPRSWAMMGFLNEICTEADAAHGVMLASLVVRADTGVPVTATSATRRALAVTSLILRPIGARRSSASMTSSLPKGKRCPSS